MILRIRKLSKRFGGVHALAEVGLEVAEGRILGLIGPNGAGKTTLFNVVNGVFPPDTGNIVFDGREIGGLPPYEVARRGIARTHQVVRPLDDLTLLENAMVGACFGRERLSRSSAKGVASDALTRVGLGGRAAQRASTLNVAEKKRLELARALSARPRLLLLDEVLAGLNPTEISLMLDTLRMIRDEGVAILMIEHVMQAVMGLSDRKSVV